MNEPLPLDQALGILYKTNNFKLNPKPLKPKPKGVIPNGSALKHVPEGSKIESTSFLVYLAPRTLTGA